MQILLEFKRGAKCSIQPTLKGGGNTSFFIDIPHRATPPIDIDTYTNNSNMNGVVHINL
jgi:hypothetical protein